MTDLKRPCIHGRYEAHRFTRPTVEICECCKHFIDDCPGGTLLPPDSLVIVKEDGEWPPWAVIAGQSDGSGLYLSEDDVRACLRSIADSFYLIEKARLDALAAAQRSKE